MLSSRRSRYLVRPRQTAIYLAKSLTSKSLPEIGRAFANRDHTTVIHSVKTIEKLKENNPEMNDNINKLKNIILINLIFRQILNVFLKLTLFFIGAFIIFSLYQAKNFKLDASSAALLLEGDKDLKYLREVNERYGSKEFLVLTYTPVSSFTEKETILNLQF